MAHNRKYIIVLIFMVLGIFISLSLLILTANTPDKNQSTNPPLSSFLSTPTPSPEIPDNSQAVVKRVEEIPQEVKERKIIDKFNYQGQSVIRINAVIRKIIKTGESYTLFLDNDQEVNITLDDKTFIGKAWFGYDDQGNVIKTEYTKTDKEKLDELIIGKKVSVMIADSDLDKNTNITVKEFVMLE